MKLQFYLSFLLGVAGVFAGSALYGGLCKKSGGPTNFQRFLFGTGFSYLLFVLLQTGLFFVDYYIPGADFQHAADVFPPTLLFYRIFGRGKGGERQFPVHATDLRILSLMFGALVGGAILLCYLERRSKKLRDDNGALDGWTYEKKSLKAYIADEWRTLRGELFPAEYLFWWVLRFLMVWAMLRRYLRDGYVFEIVLLAVNLAATFFVPLVRFVCFKKCFLGRLPFRVQTFCDIMIFFGSFMNHGLSADIREYDKYLHVVSGAIVVLIGFTLIRNTRRSKTLPAGVTALASGAFSCVVITLWELFEFFADYYITDSNNQNLLYEPSDDLLFFRVFGRGVQNPTITGVLDTDLDIVYALGGCVLFTAGLYVFLKVGAKRAQHMPSVQMETQSREVILS